MKKIKAIYLSLFLSFIIILPSNSQIGRKIISVHYSTGMPTNGLDNLINDKNFDGINVDGRYFIGNNLSLGITVGANDFKKTLERQTYQTETGSISSVRTYYFQSSPILLTSHLYLAGSEAMVTPYVGLGLGGYINNYIKWDGTFSEANNRLNFGFKPELGVLVKVWKSLGVSLKAGYNFNFYSYEQIDNVGYLEADGGVFLRL